MLQLKKESTSDYETKRETSGSILYWSSSSYYDTGSKTPNLRYSGRVIALSHSRSYSENSGIKKDLDRYPSSILSVPIPTHIKKVLLTLNALL